MVFCTILKSRSLKSCVALVGFFFSLVVCCISPAWANVVGTASYDDAHGITLYACPPTLDPLRQGQSFSLPVFDREGIAVLSNGYSGGSYGFNFQSLQFQPFDYDVSLVLGFTVIGGAGVTANSNINASAYNGLLASNNYFARGLSSSALGTTVVNPTYTNGTYNDNTYKTFLPYFVTSYVLPAGTNGFYYSGIPWTSVTFTGSDGLLSCVTGYIVHASDQNVVNQVNDILAEVKKVNGNLTSTLSVLNQILAQCREIKADTSSIVSLLGLCKDQLVSLNGKVDSIYTLLKDSLKNEAAAVDQKSEKLGGEIMQRVDSEQYWSDQNTETFNALDLGNFTFGDGVVSALPVVGNLFKGLWDSFGDATLILTFPLMLGVALVIIGRISRSSGKGSKKGGDDG